jgi:hypothetical protein
VIKIQERRRNLKREKKERSLDLAVAMQDTVVELKRSKREREEFDNSVVVDRGAFMFERGLVVSMLPHRIAASRGHDSM